MSAMASSSPRPSWHPAFMPNSANDVTMQTTFRQPMPEPQSLSELEPATLESTGDTIDADPVGEPTEVTQQQQQQQGGPGKQTDDSSAWFHNAASHDSPPRGAPENRVSLPPPTTGDSGFAAVAPCPDAESPAPAEPEQPPPQISTPSSEAKTGRDRPDSFARTVSQGLNWNDDDDSPEWTVQRSNTDDLFKFMSTSDRSNSFPDVPPLSRPATDQPTQTLHDSPEQEDDSFDRPAPGPNGNAIDVDIDEGMDAGDVSLAVFGEQEPQEEARFEEGMPLIPHEPHQEDGAGESPAGAEDFFAQSAATDDLFSEASGGADDDGFVPPPNLGRKSTMQVTGMRRTDDEDGDGSADESSGNDEPNNRGQDKIESGEPSRPQEYPHQEAETQGGADAPAGRPTQTGRELADKWSSVFADDGGDDFLVDPVRAPVAGAGTDDSPLAKAVDPADLFGSDDEGFLDDDEGFLDDDEGFLDDDEPPASRLPQPNTAPAAPAQQPDPGARLPGSQNRYLPEATLANTQPSPSPYFPAAAPPSPFVGSQPSPATAFAQPARLGSPAFLHATPFVVGQPPRPPPEPARAESFADKSKSGYSSPYDLPLDLVKTRKRPPTHAPPALPQAGAPVTHQQPGMPLPPPPPPPPYPQGSMAPPAARPASTRMQAHHAPLPPLPGQNRSVPVTKSGGGSFFEELPMTSRSRPASRGMPSPSRQHVFPYGQGPTPASPLPLPSPGHATPPHPHAPGAALPPLTPQAPPVTPGRYGPPGVAHPVAPERVGLHAPLPSQGSTSVPTPPSINRYSPAPPARSPPNGAPPPPSGRYSPVGAAPRVVSHSQPPPNSHLPRTSSPLAHFEISSHDKTQTALLPSGSDHHPERRSASAYEPRIHRMSSLPPTREEEEDEGKPPLLTQLPEHKFFAMPPRHTPPPTAAHVQATLSPPKRIRQAHAPPAAQTSPSGPTPPARSHTMSPDGSWSRSVSLGRDPVPRPQSSSGGGAPSKSPQVAYAPSGRPRGLSATYSLAPPTDGRQHDPLERWKGCPTISWGVDGTLVTSFPRDIPRYPPGQPTPVILRTPGEVRFRNIKDVHPLDEMLAGFPGPLKGKSKKKDTVSWLSAGIEALESQLPDYSFRPHLSHQNKRDRERVMLWKVLRALVENDGVLEGTPAVEAAVREILAPGTSRNDAAPSSPSLPDPQVDPGLGIMSTQIQADAVDANAVRHIRQCLTLGEREKAVWAAADKRLWGHAMLIANTVSPELYVKVTQEFVRKEVNVPGHNNESMAALYNVLCGNFEECIDELVPAHARAGFQLIPTTATGGSGVGQVKDVVDGLDKWQDTLCLILSNRRPDDARALRALGNLLSGYGRAEAAHVCFVFGRTASVFNGLDDPKADFVLVGADHKRQPDQIYHDIPALLLSEVYEYGLSLTGTAAAIAGIPHLSVYKLQHAVTLAEHGQRDRALAYCDAVRAAISSQTRRSPYHHAVLESHVEDFAHRLRQAPNEESGGGWISKPNINKVSDSVWNRFNKFVAGDDGDSAAAGNGEAGEQGPFAHITPSVSRSPSLDNFGLYGTMSVAGGPAGYGPGVVPAAAAAATPAAVPTRTGSRYAPASAQPASSPYEPSSNPYSPGMGRPSTGRSSGEFMRGSPYEPSRLSTESRPTTGYAPQGAVPGYAPLAAAAQVPFVQQQPPSVADAAFAQQHSPQALSPTSQAYLPAPESATFPAPSSHSQSGSRNPVDSLSQGMSQMSLGYEPPSAAASQPSAGEEGEGGYEPPSMQDQGGYEPPSYNPGLDGPEEGEEKPRKKKSFLDDDDDDDDDNDVLTLRVKSKEETREEKEAGAKEMFRKAAEEDAKRQAAQQQAAKRGWGFGGWFGGGKKDAAEQASKAVRAKLGEESSFVFDPELGRWVNKRAGAADGDDTPKGAPPPPAPTRSPAPVSAPARSEPSPGLGPSPGTPASRLGEGLMPPPLSSPPMSRSVSGQSRPGTSMSNASSIDDLLGAAAGTKRAGSKKPKRGGRYVDIMAK